MSTPEVITFVSHTNKPGGGELALRRYLEATSLPVRLVTLEAGGVWEGMAAEVVQARGLPGLRASLGGGGLVVANSMRAAFLTALVLPRRARLVYWVRDGLTDSAMSPLALALTRQVTARRTSHYIANSAWTAGTVREALCVAAERVDVVHSMCGVTEEMLQRPPRTAPHDPLRLLFLGRISRWKAPDVAVRALPLLRDMGVEATLTIAGGVHFGEDDYAAELRDLVDGEPSARLVGHVDDVQALLEEHDILVHCSTVPEPFGQVIVQGLATGKPVVATDAGGPQEILDGAPVPLLYPPGDPDGLASVIQDVSGRFSRTSAFVLQRAASYLDTTSVRDVDEIVAALRPRG
ncbi:glycosyltransferase [Ornithinimicrobium tianjinense]|uniref:Glycosyl transferase n=1 Tax=Ornithinimicrobium tianjinense TaxID=1195761 RepID=A0A917BQY0_9MICO|nr:glycosyltransferase [Ornithinimicrobium tianjinense]GGF53630.1 putative glycosyl transferase [Ornithinimicrobium tianjinense]